MRLVSGPTTAIQNSDFASDEYLQWSRYFPIYEGGARVLLNAIGWMLEDEALTPVRTKTLAIIFGLVVLGAVLALRERQS